MSQTAILAKSDPALPSSTWTFRNKVINGDMRIDQRNNGAAATVTSASPYIVDRMVAGMSGANGTAQRVASGIATLPYAMRLTGASGTTTSWVGTYLEAADSACLVGNKVTVSFYAAASTLTGLTLNLKSFNVADVKTATTLVESTTKVISSSLTLFTFTTTVNMTSAVANGLYIEIVPTGSLGTSTFTITGLQLEAGVTATAFEQRPYAAELQLCQRYYEMGSHQLFLATGGTAYTGCPVFYKVTKRAAATIMPTDSALTVNKISIYTAGNGIISNNIAWFDSSDSNDRSSFRIAYIAGSTCYGYYFTWTASAEL